MVLFHQDLLSIYYIYAVEWSSVGDATAVQIIYGIAGRTLVCMRSIYARDECQFVFVHSDAYGALEVISVVVLLVAAIHIDTHDGIIVGIAHRGDLEVSVVIDEFWAG